MKQWLKKMGSRKFLAAVAGIVAGLAMALGLDENVISTMAGTVTTVVSLVAYIVTEGKLDAKGLEQAAEQLPGKTGEK